MQRRPLQSLQQQFSGKIFTFHSHLDAATLRGEINNGRFAMPLGRGQTRTLPKPCSLGVQNLAGFRVPPRHLTLKSEGSMIRATRGQEFNTRGGVGHPETYSAHNAAAF